MKSYYNIMKRDKNGLPCLKIGPEDERFTRYIGKVFMVCLEQWNIPLEEFSVLVEKYKLATVIYDNYSYFTHYGELGVAEQLKEYVDNDGKWVV